MNVRCDSCKQVFEVPVQAAGNIEYAHCKNVFRVTYRYRTPCPHCRKLLKLAPMGKEGAVGLILDFASEPTDRVLPATAEDATLAREEVEKLHEPPPTVRVTKVGPKTQKAPVKESPFQYIEKKRERPRPLHVALRPPRRPALPWIRIALGVVIALGTSVTIGLTALAIFSSSSGKQTSQQREAPVKPALPPKQAAPIQPADVSPLPQGGPEFDSEFVEPIEADEPPSLSAISKGKGGSRLLSEMRLPRIDRLTSLYGGREDPFNGHERFHGGLDIAGEKRSEVKAALTGQVKFIGERGGLGRIVILSHPDGYETLYGHLEKALVRKGDKIHKGDVIGLLGSTGRSTGPHVHFELHKDGRKIDPLRAALMAKGS